MSTTDTPAPGRMEREFRDKRAAGRKLLVPYLTGGYPGWKPEPKASLVMTYYNTVHHAGHERFAAQLAAAGIVAAIVPDLPLEESGAWCVAADAAGIETVMLAAPTAPDDRLPRVAARARGFLYSVGLLGVTGERSQLAGTALSLARRLKAITDVPVLVGVGVSNAEQAREAVAVADGVVMGASVVRRMLEGGADAVGEYVAEVRHALDHA